MSQRYSTRGQDSGAITERNLPPGNQEDIAFFETDFKMNLLKPQEMPKGYISTANRSPARTFLREDYQLEFVSQIQAASGGKVSYFYMK
jgi:hypothetical protein